MTTTRRMELEGTHDGYGGTHYTAPPCARIRSFEIFRGRVLADVEFPDSFKETFSTGENRAPPTV